MLSSRNISFKDHGLLLLFMFLRHCQYVAEAGLQLWGTRSPGAEIKDMDHSTIQSFPPLQSNHLLSLSVVCGLFLHNDFLCIF